MKIRLEPHARLRAQERGATEDEIRQTLENGSALLAKSGRLAKSRILPFHQFRNGKFYEEKKVDVYYLIEGDEIITVTVFVFYGKFQSFDMQIHYNSKTDLLYIRLEEAEQPVVNKQVTEDIVLDIGVNEKIIGIEILDASKHVNLEKLMPVEFLKAS